jgi:hypothetical protein
MTARKTVEVADIQEFVNHNLQRDNLSEEAKAGMCSLLEKVLHDTGNYRGFMYDGGYKGTETYKRMYYISPKVVRRYTELQKEREENGGLR